MPAGQDAPPGATVWVAVRPEKIRLTPSVPPAEPPENRIAATVADIGYLGDTSIYQVRVRDGSLVKAAIANVGRGGGRAVTFDDQVWLSWPPEAAIVLTQ